MFLWLIVEHYNLTCQGRVIAADLLSAIGFENVVQAGFTTDCLLNERWQPPSDTHDASCCTLL